MVANVDGGAPDNTLLDETLKVEKKQRVKILSIDGGGVRGIIPAMELQHIEKKMEELGTVRDKPLIKYFDITAGVSTGSIIASGMNIPSNKNPSLPKYKMDEIVNIFVSSVGKVFDQGMWGYIPGSNVYNSKYDSKPLYDVLEELGTNVKLGDVLTELIIPTYNYTEGKPVYFQKSVNSTMLMRDAIGASTAAPTYFDPQKLVYNDKECLFIDGGIVSNNPTLFAIEKAKEKGDTHHIPLGLSLGCGTHTLKTDSTSTRGWGYAGWIPIIIQLLIQGNTQSELSNIKEMENESSHCSEKKDHICRLQVELPEERAYLDNASLENMQYLQRTAESLIKDKKDEINQFCEQLAKESTEESHTVPLETY